MFIYKNRHADIRRVHGRNTRAANVFSFTRERYHNNKYRNSPYYKGALLWETLPMTTKRCTTMLEFKKSIRNEFKKYDDIIS